MELSINITEEVVNAHEESEMAEVTKAVKADIDNGVRSDEVNAKLAKFLAAAQ